MTFQGILTGLIFAAAVFYIGRKVFYGFFRSSPKAGCDKCDLSDSVASRPKTSKENEVI